MEIQGRRRSSNFEDRGSGGSGRGAGFLVHALGSLVRLLGIKGRCVLLRPSLLVRLNLGCNGSRTPANPFERTPHHGRQV
jgi:hypothetical protein